MRTVETGDKIHLYNGVYYELPTPPPKNKILFYDKPVSKQRWERPDVLQQWYDADDKLKFETDEVIKRIYGTWFYNNGEPTYITGHHYYQLVYCKYEFGYADFRDVTKRWWYYWDLCEKDPFCYGVERAKGRRMGATTDGVAMALNIATLNQNVLCGLNSINREGAKDNFELIVNVLQDIPPFALPPMEGKDRSKSEISFREPAKTLTSKNTKITKSNSLNSKIVYAPTTLKAFDRKALKFHFIDEGGKWDELSFSKFCEIHQKCLWKGGIAYGKAYMPSTVNEMESGGGKEYKEIWDMSDNTSKTENGSTASGYWRYFTPAFDGLENYIDEYGMSVIDTPTPQQAAYLKKKWVERGLPPEKYKPIGAKEYLENDRKALEKYPDKLYELYRLLPFTEKEAFYSVNKDSQFDLIKVQDQIEWNTTARLTNNLILQRGNFVWKDDEQDTEVIWRPQTNGKFEVAWFPNKENQNRHFLKNGKLCPLFEKEGTLGIDPVDKRQSSVNAKRQSMYACYGFRYHTHEDEKFSNLFFLKYVNRLPIPEEQYEDMIKAAVFYGMATFGEINNPGTYNYFMMRGYEHYLLQRPEPLRSKGAVKTSKIERWMPSRDLGVREIQLAYLQTFIAENVGFVEKAGGFLEMPKIPFNSLLEQITEYTSGEDLTDYDEIVGALYALSTSKRNLKPRLEQKKKFIPYVKPQFKIASTRV